MMKYVPAALPSTEVPGLSIQVPMGLRPDSPFSIKFATFIMKP
jgi:hypothetical protein